MPAGKRSPWESVRDAIENSRTLTLRTATYLPRERAHIDRILAAFLAAAGMHELKNKLSYCIHELAGNAKKANTKRLFFRDSRLNIENPFDYTAGMALFKTEMIERAGFFEQRLRDENLFVTFQFRTIRGGVRIRVRNNAEITTDEQRRIRQKLAIVERFNCLADAYSISEDNAEGAGLGIVMMLFMLKTLGFGRDAFDVRAVRGETVATLTLIDPQARAQGPGSVTA